MHEDKSKSEIIKHRFAQAIDNIDVVRLLIEHNKLSAAVNRIYYGFFYALLALSTKNDFNTSKHQQLIGWFNRQYIKTEKIDSFHGKNLRKVYENRTSGDYDTFIDFENAEVEEMLEDMIRFIDEIKKHL
ncbi:MAG TPA: HEPN domain-containing protein [Prolixibacteraceae bacterium]|nr:HEPN domain-containing protein [Prolixibacteraceae bacterium]HPR60427.1 HEPN domain-containing protein [Prolixibacteraceae bacterium]